MSDSLFIEVRDGKLFAPAVGKEISRADIAMMIALGRKYIVHDPTSGEDMTYRLGRIFARGLNP
jgi:hypothetical protein